MLVTGLLIAKTGTANFRTKILDFRGFDSSRILTLRGGIPRPIGSFPGNLESTNLSKDNLSRETVRTCKDDGVLFACRR